MKHQSGQTGSDSDQPTEERDKGPQRRRGRLVVHLRDEHDKPLDSKAVVFVMENKALHAAQHRLETNGAGTASGEFPGGAYSVQAVAEDHDVGRAFSQIRPGETTEVTVRLGRRKADNPTLAERLNVYGLDVGKLELQKLTVPRGQQVALDSHEYRDRRSYTMLTPQSISDMKRWIGTPDAVFGHDEPRFGPVPKLDVGDVKQAGQIPRESVSALRAIANEYIHGNSKAVKKYELLLNTLLASRDDIISIFFFTEVTIGDGAVLEIGRNSNVFACDILHVHVNGILSVVGDVRADIGSYREFH